MHINWLALLVAAIVPLLIGFVWYHPRVFGRTWMRVAGMNEDTMKGANMAVIFALTYFLGFVIAMLLQPLVIHQMHIFSTLAGEPGVNDPNSEVGKYMADFFTRYGDRFRTFKHGALHGTITGLLMITPIIAVNALFERRGFKYIAVNAGFWIVTLALMGGIVCGWV